MKKSLLAALLFLALVPAFVATPPEPLPPPPEPETPMLRTAPAPSALPTPKRVSHSAPAMPETPAPSTASPIARNESDAIGMMLHIYGSRAKYGAQPFRKSGYVYALFRGDSEEEWIAYGWPEEYGRTGRRTFMVSWKSRILETDSRAYSGDSGPFPEAATRPTPGMAGSLKDVLSYAGTGADGNAWKYAGDIRIWRQES